MNQMLSTLLGYAQTLVLIIAIFGTSIFEKLGIQTPQIVNDLLEKKVIVMIGAFLIGNMIRTQLLSTGAFEIYFDGQLVFSKLETGQPPNEQILSHLFETHGVF